MDYDKIRISEIFAQRHIEASADEVFTLDDVNKALQKVAGGKSKGKTILKIWHDSAYAMKTKTPPSRCGSEAFHSMKSTFL